MSDELIVELPGAEAPVDTQPVVERKKPGPKSKAEKEAELKLAPIETVGKPGKGRWVLSDGAGELDKGWNWVGPDLERE